MSSSLLKQTRTQCHNLIINGLIQTHLESKYSQYICQTLQTFSNRGSQFSTKQILNEVIKIIIISTNETIDENHHLSQKIIHKAISLMNYYKQQIPKQTHNLDVFIYRMYHKYVINNDFEITYCNKLKFPIIPNCRKFVFQERDYCKKTASNNSSIKITYNCTARTILYKNCPDIYFRRCSDSDQNEHSLWYDANKMKIQTKHHGFYQRLFFLRNLALQYFNYVIHNADNDNHCYNELQIFLKHCAIKYDSVTIDGIFDGIIMDIMDNEYLFIFYFNHVNGSFVIERMSRYNDRITVINTSFRSVCNNLYEYSHNLFQLINDDDNKPEDKCMYGINTVKRCIIETNNHDENLFFVKCINCYDLNNFKRLILQSSVYKNHGKKYVTLLSQKFEIFSSSKNKKYLFMFQIIYVRNGKDAVYMKVVSLNEVITSCCVSTQMRQVCDLKMRTDEQEILSQIKQNPSYSDYFVNIFSFDLQRLFMCSFIKIMIKFPELIYCNDNTNEPQNYHNNQQIGYYLIQQHPKYNKLIRIESQQIFMKKNFASYLFHICDNQIINAKYESKIIKFKKLIQNHKSSAWVKIKKYIKYLQIEGASLARILYTKVCLYDGNCETNNNGSILLFFQSPSAKTKCEYFVKQTYKFNNNVIVGNVHNEQINDNSIMFVHCSIINCFYLQIDKKNVHFELHSWIKQIEQKFRIKQLSHLIIFNKLCKYINKINHQIDTWAILNDAIQLKQTCGIYELYYQQYTKTEIENNIVYLTRKIIKNMKSSKLCVNCRRKSKWFCGHCDKKYKKKSKRVWYCSRECYKRKWNSNECLCKMDKQIQLSK